MTYSTVELIKAQIEIQKLRDARWESMRQAKIDNDPMAYQANIYRKEGLTEAVAVLDRYIDEGLGRTAA